MIAITEMVEGSWTSVETTPFMDFDLHLYVKGESVSGRHCSVALNGKKIDCAIGDDLSITGRNSGKTLNLDITSQFSLNTGSAEVSFLSQDTLFWQLVVPPSGEFYIPRTAKLIKDSVKR